MKNSKIILSDLHLEHKQQKQLDFIAKSIHHQIELIKAQGHNPVLCLCGDVSNHIKHIDWIKSFKIDTVMTAGNHEFWESDFYDVLVDLKNQENNYFHFLYNDFCIIQDELFIGATLWTDLGENLNSSLIPFAAGRMRDFEEIKAKKWYENEDNISNLKKYYMNNKLSCDDMLEYKKWNPLIEIEENKKTVLYFNYFSSALKLHEWLSSIKIRDDFISIYEKELSEIKLNYLKKDNQILIKNLKNLKNLHINYFESSFLDESLFLDIFVKLYDKFNLPISMVTHHLPFYEELFLGHYLIDKNNLHKMREDCIFKVREGTHYKFEYYIESSSRGRQERFADLSHIVNYYNYGSKVIPEYLINRINNWYHGHEHYFNHQDLIKGIEFKTNPLSPQLAIFNFDKEYVSLHSQYLEYHKIHDDQRDNELNKKLNKIFSPHYNKFDKRELQKRLMIKTIQEFNFDLLEEIVQKMVVNLSHILDLCFIIYESNPILKDDYLSYSKMKEHMKNERANTNLSTMYQDSIDIFKNMIEYHKNIQNNQDFYIFMLDNSKSAYQNNLQQFNDMLDEFDLLINLRTNQKFNLVHHLTVYDKNQSVFNINKSYLTGWSYEMNSIEDFNIFDNGFLLRLTLKNKYCLENALKIIQMMSKFKETIMNQTYEDFSSIQIKSFDKLMDKILNLRIEDKFDKKFSSFYKNASKKNNF